MRVILSEAVSNIGAVGTVANVRDGYARNFLFPRGLAIVANERNKAELDHQIRVFEKRRSKALGEAKAIASKIEKISVTVSKQVGEDEKIFGSVTTTELEELLAQEGHKISRKDITILEDIKKVGVYAASVRIHAEVNAKFKVWVVAQ